MSKCKMVTTSSEYNAQYTIHEMDLNYNAK